MIGFMRIQLLKVTNVLLLLVKLLLVVLRLGLVGSGSFRSPKAHSSLTLLGAIPLTLVAHLSYRVFRIQDSAMDVAHGGTMKVMNKSFEAIEHVLEAAEYETVRVVHASTDWFGYVLQCLCYILFIVILIRYSRFMLIRFILSTFCLRKVVAVEDANAGMGGDLTSSRLVSSGGSDSSPSRMYMATSSDGFTLVDGVVPRGSQVRARAVRPDATAASRQPLVQGVVDYENDSDLPYLPILPWLKEHHFNAVTNPNDALALSKAVKYFTKQTSE